MDLPQRAWTGFAEPAKPWLMPRKPKTVAAPKPKHPNRLRAIRAKRGLTLEQVAERMGVSVPTISRREMGDRELKVSDLERFAAALQCEPAEILPGAGVRMVKVIGYVGAGAEVYPFDDLAVGDGLREVPCPPTLDPASIVALEVRGDSMPPLDDGWFVFYSRLHDGVGPEALGKVCVVQVANDGPMLVKQVRRAPTPGRFNLVSTNAPLREDVELEWAVPLKGMLPPDVAPEG